MSEVLRRVVGWMRVRSSPSNSSRYALSVMWEMSIPASCPASCASAPRADARVWTAAPGVREVAVVSRCAAKTARRCVGCHPFVYL